MVIFLIGVLVVSIVGMVTLLSVKSYELSTGKLLFANSRPSLSRRSSRIHFIITRWLPAYLWYLCQRVYYYLRAVFHKVFARAIVLVEHKLERVLERVKEKTSPNREPGVASPFLREVGKYKSELNQNETRAIVEE